MSVVACKVYPTTIEFASDSIQVRGWTQSKKSDDRSHVKLVQVNEMVIGSCGLSEECGHMRLFAATHKPKTATCDDILTFMSEFSTWKNGRTSNAAIENVYLIGVQGKAFYVRRYHVEEILKFEAIGAGEEYALAALHLGHTPYDAVGVACELSVYCERPIRTLTIERGAE